MSMRNTSEGGVTLKDICLGRSESKGSHVREKKWIVGMVQVIVGVGQ